MSEFHTENPVSSKLIKNYSHHTKAEIEQKLKLHRSHLPAWRNAGAAARSQSLVRLAAKLREHKLEFAQLMALEMGKPLRQGMEEVEKCAVTCEHYADRLETLLLPKDVPVGTKTHRILHEPLGSVFAVMPWNFPLWQVIRSLAPILGGGNGYILKHSDLVAGTAELIEKICDEVFEKGLVTSLRVDHKQAAELIADPRIAAVTMTGSSRGGSEVAATAGKYLKKCVLELGGSDAYLILEDADIAKAAETCAKARVINSGQSCVAAKRFIVPKSKFKEFWEKCAEVMDQMIVGQPADESTDIGPLAHKKFADQLKTQQQKILGEGGKLLWSKATSELGGAYVDLSIIEAGASQSSYANEEFFGPVALVSPYDSLEEGISLANSSRYGLGSAVFTSDLQKAEELAGRLESGVVAINSNVRSDPHLPFGGVKESGFGRELGDLGVLEFLNHKTLLR